MCVVCWCQDYKDNHLGRVKLFKKLREYFKRKRIARGLKSGKIPRGRTFGKSLGTALPAGLKTRVGIRAKLIRKDGSVTDFGEVYKEEINGQS